MASENDSTPPLPEELNAVPTPSSLEAISSPHLESGELVPTNGNPQTHDKHVGPHSEGNTLALSLNNVEQPLPPVPTSSLHEESAELRPTSEELHYSDSTTSFQDVPLDPPPPVSKSLEIVVPKPINGTREVTTQRIAALPQSPPVTSISSVHTPPLRRASLASDTFTHQRSLTLSRGKTLSVVLITSALDTIAASREAKRSSALRDSTQHALDLIKEVKAGEHPRAIFEPLRLACETRNEKLMIASLDCIAKLISHSFFVEDALPTPALYASPPTSPSGAHQPGASDSLQDLVAHTITSAYTETTPDAVSLQIVKALLALVLSSTILVHHSSLLKAVRTVYNVFLLSQDPVNQMVAQGGLTQMVNHVFSRCNLEEMNLSKANGYTESAHSPVTRRDSILSTERSSPVPRLSTPDTTSIEITHMTKTEQVPNANFRANNGDAAINADETTLNDSLAEKTFDDQIAGEPVGENPVAFNAAPQKVPSDGKVRPPVNTVMLYALVKYILCVYLADHIDI